MNTKITITKEAFLHASSAIEAEHEGYYGTPCGASSKAGMFQLNNIKDNNTGWRTSAGNWILLVDEVEECCLYFSGRRHAFVELLRFLPEDIDLHPQYLFSRATELPGEAGVAPASELLLEVVDKTPLWFLELQFRICEYFELGWHSMDIGWTASPDALKELGYELQLPKGLVLECEYLNGGTWWTVQRAADTTSIGLNALYTAYKSGVIPYTLLKERIGDPVYLEAEVEGYNLDHEYRVVFSYEDETPVGVFKI